MEKSPRFSIRAFADTSTLFLAKKPNKKNLHPNGYRNRDHKPAAILSQFMIIFCTELCCNTPFQTREAYQFPNKPCSKTHSHALGL